MSRPTELQKALLVLISDMTSTDNPKKLYEVKIDGMGTIKLACQVVGVIPEEVKIIVAGG